MLKSLQTPPPCPTAAVMDDDALCIQTLASPTIYYYVCSRRRTSLLSSCSISHQINQCIAYGGSISYYYYALCRVHLEY